MVKPDTWIRQLQERPDRPQGRQRRQLVVLVILAGQLDAKTGEGHASVREMAKTAAVSVRTVNRAISWAAASELLEQTSRGHRLGDGAIAASGWRLLMAVATPQGANPASQRANSRPQRASSRPQAANSAKPPKSQPPRLPRNHGTPTPPPVHEVLNRAWCTECGFPLDPAVAADGVHPTCATDQPNPAKARSRSPS